MRLKDRVTVVTGAGGGLGQGICLCLAREGAHVVASDLKMDLAEDTASKVRETGRKAVAVQTDVRAKKECQALIAKSLKEMGRVDILVCCAGVSGIGDSGLMVEAITEDELNRTIDVNLKGVFFCNQLIVPYFKERKGGRIINISSVAGRTGMDVDPVYSATKSGVIMLTQSLARQLAPYNVNVNTICPGLIWTPMMRTLTAALSNQIPELKGLAPEQVFELTVKQRVPMGRPQMPEDIGNAVVFLASDEAKEITGQALNVDGGSVMN
jgi:meso-butanediol dehydrogenase / (S,S)-butanediol dehydrogenase / diacetyl reductase